MRHTRRAKRKFFSQTLALVLALTIMMSTVLVSGLSLTVFASSSISGTILYLDVSANSDWQGKTVVASFDNGVTQTAQFSGSGNVISVNVPSQASGANRMTLTAYPSSYPTTLAKNAPTGKYRIITKKVSSRDHCYAWNSVSNSKNAELPGQTMTSSDDYYYIDLNQRFDECIFNGGSDQNKSGDLTVNYNGNVAYYDGSSFVNPQSTTVDISNIQSGQNLFVMNSNDSVSVSKYPYNGSGISTTMKTVQLYASGWSNAYVTYDLSDAYQTTLAMTAKTSADDVKYFECKVPESATFRFQPRQSSTASASPNLTYPGDSTTLYIMDAQKYWTALANLPTDTTRIPNNFSSNEAEKNIFGVTATYFDYMTDNEIDYGYLNRADGRQDTPFEKCLNKAIDSYSKTNNIKNPLYFGNFYGWGDNSHYNFKNIVNNSAELNNYWYSVQGLASNELVNNQLYVPASNSSGAAQSPLFDSAWLGGNNSQDKELAKVFDSYFPFVSTTDDSTGVTTYSFDSSGGGEKSNSDNVYFTWDGTTPVAVNYGYGEEYAVSDGTGEFSVPGTGYGIFPFNSTSKTMSIPKPGGSVTTKTIPASDVICVVDNSGWGNVWCHAWGSSDIWFEAAKKDGNNYYFHKGQFPSTVGGYQFTHEKENYDHQSADLSGFGKKYTNSSDKNWNSSTTNTDTLEIQIVDSYTRTGSNALDYGFGIRMDMDFRVPKNGLLGDTESGSKPVTFDYSGDDDLWVYISDDTGHSELVLDLGGDHKMTSGKIDFSTMKATADFVQTNYNTETTEKPAVPSTEVWIKKDSYSTLYLKTWNKIDENGNPYDTYIAPRGTVNYKFSDGSSADFFRYRISDLSGAKEFTINTAQTTSSELCTLNMGSASVPGNAFQINDRAEGKLAETYTHTNSSGSQSYPATGVENSFFGGQHLDPNKTYHMTVFYIERGLIESNLKISFTMTPVTNDLLIDKAVEIPNINNSTIAKAVYDNDTFGYISSNSLDVAKGKAYTYTKQSGDTESLTLGDNGSFGLKDNESAYFVSQFKTGSNMSVNESSVSSMKNGTSLSDRYSTKWELFDDDGNSKGSGNSTQADFKLEGEKNKNVSLELAYTNTLKTGELNIKKQVTDKSGKILDINQDFSYQILLDVSGGTDYKAYPLNYTVSGTDYYTSDGTVTFSPKSTVNIKDLPIGTTYKITEKVPEGYTCTNNNQTGTISSTAHTVTFKNMQSDGEGEVVINKNLDGKAYTGSQFEFVLQGLTSAGEGYIDASSISSTESTVNNGKVTFKVKFSEVGKYRFSVKENPIASNLIGYKGDSNTYYIELAVKADADNNLVIDTCKYYKDASFKTPINSITFENTSEKGKIIVNKTNPANNSNGTDGTEFAVIRVSKADGITGEVVKKIMSNSDLKSAVVAGTGATSNGKVEFNNLPIYQDGSKMYDPEKDEAVAGANYLTGTNTTQIYCVVEYKATSGYNLNSTPYYVTFPVKAGNEQLAEGYTKDSEGYVKDKDGNYVFTQTFNYTNYPVVVPDASGDGMFGWIKLGLMIIAGAGVLTALYFGYNQINRKRRMARAEAHIR